MAGNDSLRLVIPIQLARNWANANTRCDRATKRVAATADEGNRKRLEEEVDALGEACDLHPCPGFVRRVSQETGDEQSRLTPRSRISMANLTFFLN
jgi:hypothetical protein